MKRFMMILMLGLPLPAGAQEGPRTVAKAAVLEQRAATLLDQGRRAEAFELLAQAADLREKARAARESKAKAKSKTKTKTKAKAKTTGQKGPQQAFQRAIRRMDGAIQANDMAAAKEAATAARAILVRWAKRLAAREKAASQPRSQRLLKRVEALERQVTELRRMLAGTR